MGWDYRYRLHRRDLPGRPDMVFQSRRRAIFVHGCFWHRHPQCKLARIPKSRQEFWVPKLEGNRKRDLENQRRLREIGWDLMVIWECETRDRQNMADRIKSFLGKQRPTRSSAMKSVELFAGAGGLAMGASLAGFESQAIVEWDRWACDTIRENRDRQYPLVKDWPLHEDDVRDFDCSLLSGDIDLVAGGPPCQPFSIGGKHRGHMDERDMFSAMVDVVEQLKPRALIVENVRGLTRPKFSNYFSYVLLRFEFPEIRMREGEKWTDHLARLERQKTSGRRSGLTYEIVHRVLNAADFGVPQWRERVFIVGFREDVGVKWSFADAPETHSLDALLSDQWITGEYWERHGIPDGDQRPISTSFRWQGRQGPWSHSHTDNGSSAVADGQRRA